jgi:ATP-dependent Lon protease
VGGIKEKVLAARRMGLREVILPKQNEKNILEDLTPEQRRDMTFHYVEEMDDVLRIALTPALRRIETPRQDDQRPRFSLA